VPKNIGFFLVRESQEKMQYSLYNELLKNESLIESLSEPPEITAQRDTAKKTLEVLNKARRIIRREVSNEEQLAELEKSKIK
jgi:dynamin 1-like protein